MNPGLSTYLNLLRVIGALEVFVGHLCIWQTDCGLAGRLPWLGSDGVVIFFVLSGYVIAYTAKERDRTARSYVINRCARIYSVVLPAAILTIGLEWVGIKWFPQAYDAPFDHYQFANLGIYLPLWLTFTSELWGLNEPMLTNGAFWSLCFEVWFYIFFAALLFTRGTVRVVSIAIIALMAGPKICILFPLWGVGMLAYYLQRKRRLTHAQGRLLTLASIGAYLMLKLGHFDDLAMTSVNTAFHDWPRQHLQMAWQFPGYILIALCVAGSIYGMRFAELSGMTRLARPVSVAASFTFTIYLTHMPLLKFTTTLAASAGATMLVPVIATLLCIAGLGVVTEHRVKAWRTGFTHIASLGDRAANEALRVVRGA